MDREQLEQNKFENRLQSIKMIGGMAVILGLIGFAVGGITGAIVAIIFALLVAGFGPGVSSGMILRMYKAQKIMPEQAPELFQIHQLLCQRAELDNIPGLFYVPSRTLNAFATGTDKTAAVAVTDGLLRALNTRELAGVLAHEISHVRHHDVRIMSLADSFSRISSTVSRLGLLGLIFTSLLGTGVSVLWRMAIMLLAPMLTTVLQLALSRSRELIADMGAIELTRDPEGLASALLKLEKMQPKGILRRMLYPGNNEPESAALRSHPLTKDRVARLMELVPKYEHQPHLVEQRPHREHYPVVHSRVRRRPTWHIRNGLWH